MLTQTGTCYFSPVIELVYSELRLDDTVAQLYQPVHPLRGCKFVKKTSNINSL